MPFDLEKIKVGDYVRTKKGNIGKFKFYGFDDVDEKIVYFKNSNGTSCVDEPEIVKNSPNIIDLIEVGDYVNGNEVLSKYYNGQLNVLETTGEDINAKCLSNDEIRSVVTKEQFKSVEYKVGG